jgi:hypothetical protein
LVDDVQFEPEAENPTSAGNLIDRDPCSWRQAAREEEIERAAGIESKEVSL